MRETNNSYTEEIKAAIIKFRVPASQVLDRENWYDPISRKAVGRMAGLGWQGKSLLLVTPHFAPPIRLVTVLTDSPLKTDIPIRNLC